MAEEQEITAPFDTEELQQGWEERAPSQPTLHVALRFGARSDLGQVRENNEDKFEFMEPDDATILARRGRIYAVADGMGGHSAGQIASELGLKVFMRRYYQDGASSTGQALRNAVRDANEYVLDIAKTIPGRSGMGTTLTAAVVREDDLIVAQVGDSRLYLIRDGEIEQVTEDHSWVAEHVRRGTLTPEEAEIHPHRNVITRSLGGMPEVLPDLFERKVQPGDRYVLCSDGLSGMISDAQILQVGSAESPSVAAWNLVELANEQGGKDNITAMVVEILGVEPWTPRVPLGTSASETMEAPDAGSDGAASMPSEVGNSNLGETNHPPVAEEAPGASRGVISRFFNRGG